MFGRQVDRPLFKDYWERLLASLEAAAEKGDSQRKVARLTLLKDVNDEDIFGYAKLIDLMKADFIEVDACSLLGECDGLSFLSGERRHLRWMGSGCYGTDDGQLSVFR